MQATGAQQATTVQAFVVEPRVYPSRRWLMVAVLIAIVVGIFFRFYHLDRKVYWEDETYTSLHVLGVTEAEVVRQAPTLSDAGALRRVLHPGPAQQRGIGDTLHSLATEDPQHPPFYYVFAHLWVKAFGDATGTIRLLSAIVGVAALPCMYWLCIELFGSATAAWLGVALLAVSPIAVLFSQEAREYVMWSAGVTVMGAALLRALRIPTRTAWAFYALTVGASLYIFPVSAFTALGNIAVVASLYRRKPHKILAVIAASLAGAALFVPWMAVVLINFHTVDHAMGLSLGIHSSKLDVLKQFIGLLKLNFLDFNLIGRHVLSRLSSLVVVPLVAYAFFDLCRAAPRRTRLFIVALVTSSSLGFVLPDLFLAQHFTMSPRYFLPLYIAIDLAIVALLADRLTSMSLRGWQRGSWALVFIAVIAVRIASCGASSSAQTWWTKFGERSIDVAQAINASPHPLLISAEYIERPLSLSNYLADHVAVALRPRCYLCRDEAHVPLDLAATVGSATHTDVFVLGPSPQMERDVKAAIVNSASNAAYRCIHDRLDESSACSDTLWLWPISYHPPKTRAMGRQLNHT